MAHTASTAGPRGRAPRAAGAPGRSPRRRGLAGLGWPLTLGVLYGLWAAQIERSTPRPGPISTGNVVFGVVSGLVVTTLAFLLRRMPRRLSAELRAAAWAVFSGSGLSYLYSVTEAPVVRTVVIGILTAGGIFVIAYYFFHTRGSQTDIGRYYAEHGDTRTPT